VSGRLGVHKTPDNLLFSIQPVLLAPGELLAQPTQCKSGKQQPEITQRNVEVPGD
jgi:hypothetical protein